MVLLFLAGILNKGMHTATVAHGNTPSNGQRCTCSGEGGGVGASTWGGEGAPSAGGVPLATGSVATGLPAAAVSASDSWSTPQRLMLGFTSDPYIFPCYVFSTVRHESYLFLVTLP